MAWTSARSAHRKWTLLRTSDDGMSEQGSRISTKHRPEAVVALRPSNRRRNGGGRRARSCAGFRSRNPRLVPTEELNSSRFFRKDKPAPHTIANPHYWRFVSTNAIHVEQRLPYRSRCLLFERRIGGRSGMHHPRLRRGAVLAARTPDRQNSGSLKVGRASSRSPANATTESL